MKFSSFLGALLLGCAAFFTITAPAQDSAKGGEAAAILLETAGTADTIIYNARVLTVDSNFSVAQALAVRDGRILAVGKDKQMESYRGPETRMLDAQGRLVLPGLYDANVHSYKAAVSELKAPLPVIDSISNAQAYIRQQATNKSVTNGWIVLEGPPPTRLNEGRLPTKAELDAATTNLAVLWNFGPVAVVNSKALAVSKITKETQDPKNGQIEKELKHLTPTGLLRNAVSVLKLPPAAKAPTKQQQREALKRLYQLYNEQGITSIGEAQTGPVEIDLFRDLSQSNELTVRINCARLFEPGDDLDAAIDRLNALTNAPAGKLPYGPTGAGDDWVRIGPLKTAIDGEASIGTAYLRTPYGIGPTYKITELAYRGESKQDSYLLPQFYLEATQRGWQLAGHASGDAALDSLLNAYEKVQFQTNIHDRRFLITDAGFQAAQNWDRCAKLGLGVVLEPGTLYQDGASLLNTLGTNRLTYFVPMKGWFDRGITAGGASDHLAGLNSLTAANPWNPWLGLWTTLTRETRAGTVIKPEEQLTREQAIRFYTINNAWLNLEDQKKGSLETGKLADLIIVDTDLLKCPVDDIRNTKVLLTMVNGKVVYEARLPVFPGPEVVFPTFTANQTNAPQPNVDGGATTLSATNAVAGAANDLASSAQTNQVATNAATAVALPSVGKPDGLIVPITGPAAGAAEAEIEPVVAANPATATVVTNQATVITVSNQTASITVTIQPTATVTNQDASVTITNLPMSAPTAGSTPGASTNAAVSPAPVPAVPSAMNEQPAAPTTEPVATATSADATTTTAVPVAATPAVPETAATPVTPTAVVPASEVPAAPATPATVTAIAAPAATETNSATSTDWSKLMGAEAKK